MHLLYLDDSGSTGNASEDYFVLAGIALPENSIRWLSHKLDELAISINKDDPQSVEFHAAAIYNGKGPIWEQFHDRGRRRQIIKDVLCILDTANSEIRVFGCAVHKKSFPGIDPVEMAFEDVSGRFDLYLSRITSEEKRARGMIVIDKTSYENSIQKLVIKFRQEGNRWGNQLRNISEVPLFVDSKSSRIIQLADHIAYGIFRRYNANDLNYFNCIEARIDQADGKYHGLSHRQTYTSTCTCPACITRRV